MQGHSARPNEAVYPGTWDSPPFKTNSSRGAHRNSAPLHLGPQRSDVQGQALRDPPLERGACKTLRQREGVRRKRADDGDLLLDGRVGRCRAPRVPMDGHVDEVLGEGRRRGYERL